VADTCGDRLVAKPRERRRFPRVQGDDVAFAIVRVGFGDTIRIDYTGKIAGDTMKLTLKIGAREPLDVTATRIH